MSLTIRQRCQAVAQCLHDHKGIQGIARIAALTGLSKSSVHRHQQAIARRNQYPESLWWETQPGSFWLKLLVLDFGQKAGQQPFSPATDRGHHHRYALKLAVD